LSSFRALARTLAWYARSGTHAARNWLAVQRGTRKGRVFFQHELADLFECDADWLADTAAEYRRCIDAWWRLSAYQSPSQKADGFAKTLDVAEGFALWALVKRLRPRVVVELGTQRGLSARLWKEALCAYVPGHELILCDIEDRRAFIRDADATFLLGDARRTLAEVFATRRVDVLFNDAHPYDLIKWSVQEGLKHGVPVFVFHDVGRRHPRANFRAESAHLSPEERALHGEDIGQYGHWERHVMAEIFDPRIVEQDSGSGGAYRLRIFDSLYGLGIALSTQTQETA
jgi:hypothetical protein